MFYVNIDEWESENCKTALDWYRIGIGGRIVELEHADLLSFPAIIYFGTSTQIV